MKDLDQLCLTRLDEAQLKSVNGGLIIARYKKLLKAVDWVLRAAGVYAIVDEVREGYNECR